MIPVSTRFREKFFHTYKEGWMDLEALKTKQKVMKTKAKAARKAGKPQAARSFRKGAKRLLRALQAAQPKATSKTAEASK
mgnify:CR=1 FL=1